MWKEILNNLMQVSNNYLANSKTAQTPTWGKGGRSSITVLDMKKQYSYEVEEKKPNEKISRTLYFYEPVDSWSVSRLIKDLRYIQDNLKDSTKDIWLYINSGGGSLLEGFNAMDEILNIKEKIPINTVIDNTAASAATLMSIAGTERYIKKNGFILIHELSSLMVGKYSSMQDQIENMNLFMKKIKTAYTNTTKIPGEALDEMLRHDFWWDSDTALDYGLVDHVA